MKNNELYSQLNELNYSLKSKNEKINGAIDNFSQKILNKEVIHEKFGTGRIIDKNESIIYVKFNDKIREFSIPDSFADGFLKIDDDAIDDCIHISNDIKEKEELEESIKNIQLKIKKNESIDTSHIKCKEARLCIEKGNICVDDDIEFKTIRDVSDLFNKNYKGLQKSWIQIDNSDWYRVASCFQMVFNSERNVYSNNLTSNGNVFYYYVDGKSDIEKEEAVRGIIDHEMKVTYLFLKYPFSEGYKFVGIFEKDNDAVKEAIRKKDYKVVYKKTGDKLDLTQFFK